MTKLAYLAAVGLLGLGFTVAQNTTTPSDASNSNGAGKASQAGAAPAKGTPAPDQNSASKNKSHSQNPPSGVPDTTVRDQQGSTTSTTGASGQSDNRPSTSTMGTTGNTPGTEDAAPTDKSAQPGSSTDQQPNSSSSPTAPTPHLVMNQTPGARAIATHTPDPGTCMNPVAMQTGQYPPTAVPRNCD